MCFAGLFDPARPPVPVDDNAECANRLIQRSNTRPAGHQTPLCRPNLSPVANGGCFIPAIAINDPFIHLLHRNQGDPRCCAKGLSGDVERKTGP